MNYETLKKKIIASVSTNAAIALNDFLTAASQAFLHASGVEVGPVADAVEQTAAAVATKKPAAITAPVEGGKRRATDVEMVTKLTDELAEQKAKGSSKEKIAATKARLDKYVAKVKAAGKTVPAVTEAPETDGAAGEEPVPEPKKSGSKFASKGKAKAKATAPAPDGWNGKSGIIPVKVGSAVIITTPDEFDGEPMKYRVVEVDLENSRLSVFPAELAGEPDLEGILPEAEEDSNFTPAWITIEADGSNLKLVRKSPKS